MKRFFCIIMNIFAILNWIRVLMYAHRKLLRWFCWPGPLCHPGDRVKRGTSTQDSPLPPQPVCMLSAECVEIRDLNHILVNLDACSVWNLLKYKIYIHLNAYSVWNMIDYGYLDACSNSKVLRLFLKGVIHNLRNLFLKNLPPPL